MKLLLIIFFAILIIASLYSIYTIWFSPFSLKFNEMMIEKNGLPIVRIKSLNKEFNFLVDCGSNLSHVNLSVIDAMDSVKLENVLGSKITTGNGETENCGYYNVKLTFGKRSIIHRFEIMDLNDTFYGWGMPIHGIIGVDFLRKYGYTVDFKHLLMYRNV